MRQIPDRIAPADVVSSGVEFQRFNHAAYGERGHVLADSTLVRIVGRGNIDAKIPAGAADQRQLSGTKLPVRDRPV